MLLQWRSKNFKTLGKKLNSYNGETWMNPFTFMMVQIYKTPGKKLNFYNWETHINKFSSKMD